MVYGILILSDSVMCFGLMFPWDTLKSRLFIAFYQVLLFLVTWSHLTCMLSDPGVVPKDEQEMQAIDLEGQKRCKKCDAPKPFRAHHCSICKRCIMKMDHHCPWVNTCVAEYNQKHFLLFLLYVFLLSAVTVAVIFSRILACHNDTHGGIIYSIDSATWEEWDTNPGKAANVTPGGPGTGDSGPSLAEMTFLAKQRHRRIRMYCGLTQGYMLAAMGVFFIALLFGLFTVAMFGDQISSLMANQTNIEQLQQTPAKPRYVPRIREKKNDDNARNEHAGKEGETRRKRKQIRSLKIALQDVCGGGYTWRWLLPLPIKKSMRGVTY